MSIEHTCYLTANGKIQFSAVSKNTIEDLNIAPPVGKAYVEGRGNPRTEYVTGGAIVTKLVNPTTINKTTIIADGIDEFVLSGYPVDARIRISGSITYNGVLTAGNDSFITTVPGNYIVLVKKHPYLDKEFIINASQP